ncbi:MAG: GHKL domain-containing protein [Pseudomonadota bacterium]|nr:MAG: GHKL domain-containing protein [Pseudomonadota bacterium]
MAMIESVSADEAGVQRALNERQAARFDELVAMINEVTAPLTGGDYFRSLVAKLAQNLGVDAALVTECLEYPENHVRTLAYWEGGGLSENIEFDLVGTPCEHVISGNGFCFYPDRMSERYPEWASEEGGVESFIGIPVFAPSDGRIVGHIAVFDRRPMEPDTLVESMFRIIAARAGAEIERIQAEKALRDSEARARQHLNELAHVSRVSTMGEMASAVAHEVNQPLTAIMTYCRTSLRMLKQGRLDPDSLREAMEKSLANAERTQRVVHKLREFVRRGDIRRRPVPMARLVSECAVLLETEAHHHRVQLDLQMAAELPVVKADPILIQQVLFNLARNGIEAINDSDHEERVLTVRVFRQDTAQVIVKVTDTGNGVSETIRDRLFEPFASTRKQGMGIGLSLCKSVVDNHEGRMWLEEDTGSGATFCFSLPEHIPAAPSGPA